MTDFWGLLEAAIAQHRAEQFEAARTLYHRVLALTPESADGLHLLGAVHRRTGDRIGGLAWMRRALAVDPNLEPARHNLNIAIGDALTAAEHAGKAMRCDEATTLCRAVLQAAPDHGVAHMLLALTLASTGDEAGARRALDAVDPASQSTETALGVDRFLRSRERERTDGPDVGAFVVPVYNMADYVERGLDSIVQSIRYYRSRRGGATGGFRIAVVNDNSTDNSLEVVNAWARRQTDPGLSIVVLSNPRNIGAGRSRNLGASLARGPYLWFLDADDYVFENHVDICVDALERFPAAGFVRTGMRFESGIDIPDDFRTASESTYPCNMCVRLACHEFVGGFPEAEMFFPNAADDVAYSRWLARFFICAWTPTPTVHYTIRPGNALDLQLREKAAAQTGDAAKSAPDGRWVAIETYIRWRQLQLQGRLDQPWDGPPLIGDGQSRRINFTPTGQG